MMGTAIKTIFMTVQTTSHSVGPSSPAPKSLIAEIISISGWLHRYISIAAAQGGRLRKGAHNTNGPGRYCLVKLDIKFCLTMCRATTHPGIRRQTQRLHGLGR